MAYSTESDMLYGDLGGITPGLKTKHLNQAKDEVDSTLGFMYEVPFTEVKLSPAGWTLVKRINNFLASGRLIMEVDSAGEDSRLHRYGQSLVEQAQAAMQMILAGEIVLTKPDTPGDGVPPLVKGIRVGNQDPYSMVDAFYGFTDPRTPGHFGGGR